MNGFGPISFMNRFRPNPFMDFAIANDLFY